MAFRPLSSYRFLGSAQRLGAGGAIRLHSSDVYTEATDDTRSR